MKQLAARVASGAAKLYPAAKKFGFGLLLGIPLFVIGTFSMGYFAGAYGLPAPQVDTSELQTAVGNYLPGGGE